MNTPHKEPHRICRALLNGVSAAIALIVLLPVFAAVALLIFCADGRPIFFTQMRVGRKGRLFYIWKFRTMVATGQGPAITVAGDLRVTRVGRLLRRYKIDELPQLANVLKGEMSLVGPRPEVPECVDYDAPVWRAILSVRPGITDPAALVYHNEEYLLAYSDRLMQSYRECVLPNKLLLSLKYLNSRSFRTDISLIFLTIQCSFLGRPLNPTSLTSLFNSEVPSR